MSTLDSYCLVAGGNVSYDIYRPAFKQEVYDKELITVFSAPNYCGEFDNSGAMMSIDQDLLCSFKVLKPNKGKK